MYFILLFNNGLTLEWGRLDNIAQDTSTVITLPKALTTSLYCVVVTAYTDRNGKNSYYLNGNATHTYTKTNFKILDADYGHGKCWFAIGK